MKSVTYSSKTRLFTIPCNGGFSCLGVEICRNRAAMLSAELGETLAEDYRAKRFDSPLALYADYCRLVEAARAKNSENGWRSQSELTPELVGLEGKRVEIVHSWPKSGKRETIRFQVGRSTGFIPCHLMIHNSRCSGGPAVCLGKIETVRVIR